MSGRRNANRIRGPQSALTDFLAVNNISAAQIRDDYQRRRAQAEADHAAATGGPSDTKDEEEEQEEQAAAEEAIRQTRRRREIQDEAISKIKKGKGKSTKSEKKKDKKKGKKKKGSGSEDDSGSEFDADAEFGGYKKSVPLPGQLEHCEICGKRFTVTPYSKSGPEGGLVCTPCGKELTKEADKASKDKKKQKGGPTGRKRRKLESDRLDGRVTLGAKTLQLLCLEKASQYAGDMEDLGDLPDRMVDRLSEIFTKKRVMKSNVLPLFSKEANEKISIHDCAYLRHEDFTQMLATSSHVKKLVLGNACQFHSRTMQYMTEKITTLRWLHLYAANLIENDTWKNFIIERGEILDALQLADLDTYFENEHIELLVKYCPNLTRLKLKRCRRVTPDCLESISRMQNLQHLSLQFSTGVAVPHDQLLNLITSIGPQLHTLSLDSFADADDNFIDAMGSVCGALQKFRFNANDTISDAAWTTLFQNWANPPLRFIDISCTRDVDNAQPHGPEEDPIGLGTFAFPAMMKHSASKLQYLNIASCRHISYDALTQTFDGLNLFPELLEVDLSFVTNVDTLVLAGLFKSAPKLRKVVAFGCFGVEDVVVPQGIVVIGVPRAQDAIEQFGVVGLDVETALGSVIENFSLNAGNDMVEVGA